MVRRLGGHVRLPRQLDPRPLFDPQSLNRYGYVLNNPLRYSDPTGRRACEGPQGECWYEDLPVQGYASNPVVNTATATSTYWNLVVQSRNEAAPEAEVTIEEWSGSGGVVGWTTFGNPPWMQVGDSYTSNPDEVPAFASEALVNILEPFAETNYLQNLNSAPGVGNVIAIAFYSYSAQGLSFPSVTVSNQSEIFAGASMRAETMFGAMYQSESVAVPVGTTASIYAPVTPVFAPYQTVELTVDISGYVEGRTRFFAEFQFHFPSGVSGNMPYWANP